MKRLLYILCVLIIISLCGCEDSSAPTVSSAPYEGIFAYRFTRHEIRSGGDYCSEWNPGDSIDVSIRNGEIYFGGKRADWSLSKKHGYTLEDWSNDRVDYIYYHYSEREISYINADSFVAHFGEKLIWSYKFEPWRNERCEAYYTIEAYR